MNDGQIITPSSQPQQAGPAGIYPTPTAGINQAMPAAMPVTNTAPVAAPTTNPNSTQNSLLISEIRDGLVIMSDGTFRAVVMCKSINFDLMSPQEREAVEFSYQGFLNSLYFPVQIFIRSQKVDMSPYLDKLVKIRSEQDNMLLGLLMDDYVDFLGNIAQQTNIMDKKFYIVIQFPEPDENLRSALNQSKGFFSSLGSMLNPKNPHITINESLLENAKTELRNRVQAVMQGLQQCGIQSLPLDTQELIELYYDAYNPDTATRQQLKNFDSMTTPVVTKGEGAAPQPNLDRQTA